MAMTLRRPVLPLLAAAGGLFVVMCAGVVLGPVAIALPLAVAAALALFASPKLAVTAAIGLAVVVESEDDWGPVGSLARVYELIPGTKITGNELIIVLALAAAIAQRIVRDEPIRLPRPFVGPLGLVVLGLAAGAWTGHAAGFGWFKVFDSGRTVLPLLLVPLAVVNVIDDRRDLRRAIGVAGGLAVFKALAGLFVVLTGTYAHSVGQRLTYYEGPPNMVLLGFIAVVFVLALTRVPAPKWTWVGWPLAVAAILLSFRRSYWIATVAALVLGFLLVIARRGWWIVPPAIVAAVAGALLIALNGAGPGLTGAGAASDGGGFTVQSRLQSLRPANISANREDRYRIDERRNVWADLRDHPIAGIGLGPEYRQRYALSVGDITHEYVHVGVLWWWMKLGILGLLAYIGVIGGAIWAGWVVWTRHADGLVRATGGGLLVAVAGYAVAEATATYAGADSRASTVLGAALALLAAGYAQSAGNARVTDRPVGLPWR